MSNFIENFVILPSNKHFAVLILLFVFWYFFACEDFANKRSWIGPKCEKCEIFNFTKIFPLYSRPSCHPSTHTGYHVWPKHWIGMVLANSCMTRITTMSNFIPTYATNCLLYFTINCKTGLIVRHYNFQLYVFWYPVFNPCHLLTPYTYITSCVLCVVGHSHICTWACLTFNMDVGTYELVNPFSSTYFSYCPQLIFHINTPMPDVWVYVHLLWSHIALLMIPIIRQTG